MNNDYCLVFVDGPLLPFLFLASQKKFEVAASLKHLPKGGLVPVINNNRDFKIQRRGRDESQPEVEIPKMTTTAHDHDVNKPRRCSRRTR